MVRAFAAIDVAAGVEEDLCRAIREIEGVVEAHLVAGDFDLIAEVETADVRDVLSTITRDIRPLEGVGTTRTYICLE